VSALEFVRVPAGPFAMGTDPARDYPPDEDEMPRRVVAVQGFRIGRLPVLGDDGVPVTYISRDEAEACCVANGVRLPTEIEWEAAARGGDDRLWPWGDEVPDATRATFGRGIGGPSLPGLHPAGSAPCGAQDLAGNVYEWTADGAVRGGSYLSGPDELRCSARLPAHPAARDPYIGFRVVAVEPRRSFDWVEVPAGNYVIGRDPGESRQRLVEVNGFELARTPVTNAQYGSFVAETGATAPPHWPAADDHPVTFVDWHEASAYCAWAGGRLPTEAEWEKAARGTDGRTYPWGDEEDEGRAEVGTGIKHGSTSPVGSHLDGASPYGLLDMAGNVWEWTSTEYSTGERILRGGSFASPDLAWARCTMRSHCRPGRRQAHIGFRVARGAA
jgi:formylglycine-generating enzyme required for sulfatase activity